MDEQELANIRNEYTAISDDELIDLALQGEDQFVKGAYGLVMAEVRKRKLGERVETMRSADDKAACQARPWSY